MTSVTFTREAPSHHEDGPSYTIKVDGQFVGEIITDTDRDESTGSYRISCYTVDLHGHRHKFFSVKRTVWSFSGGEWRTLGEYETARKALAAAKAYARKLLGDG